MELYCKSNRPSFTPLPFARLMQMCHSDKYSHKILNSQFSLSLSWLFYMLYISLKYNLKIFINLQYHCYDSKVFKFSEIHTI